MASQKRSVKKHRFSPSNLGGNAPVPESAKSLLTGSVKQESDVRDTSYVLSDIRRVLVLASAFITIELLLWALSSRVGL